MMCDYTTFDNINTFDIINKLSILTVNIRGIKGKFQELLGYIELCKIHFSFIILVEVWLNNTENFGFNIPNYKSYTCLRNNRIGGGIVIYCSNSLKTSVVEEKTGIFPTHESLTIKSQIGNLGDIFVCAIYRPPNRSIDAFNDYLQSNLVFYNNEKCIIAGDLNCDLLTESMGSRTLAAIMQSFSFVKCIDKPTYFSATQHNLTSCLDHYWHNLGVESNAFILGPPIADHMAIVLLIDAFFDSREGVTVSFRNFSHRNKCRFLDCIGNEINAFSFLTDDVNMETSRVLDWLKSLADKYFPIKHKTVTGRRSDAPWLTSDIIRCINKKHRWFKLLKAKLITYNCYKKYCNILKKTA